MFALQTSLSQLLLEVSAKVAEIAAVQYFVVIETPYERKFGGNKQLCELFMEEELNRDSDADTDGQFSFRDSNKTREQDQHVSNNLKQKRKIKIKPPKEPQSKKTASSTQQKRKRKAEGEIDPKDSGLTEPKQFDQDFEIKTETFDDFQVSCIEEGDLESGMKFQPEADDVLSGFPNQDIQNSEILKVQPVHLKEDLGMGTKTQLGVGVDEGASDFLDLDMDMVQTENAEELNDKVYGNMAALHLLSLRNQQPIRRRKLTIAFKYGVIDAIEHGLKPCDACDKFQLPQSTVSTIMRKKDQIKKYFLYYKKSATMTRKKDRRYALIETHLYEWFLKAKEKNIPINGPMMKQKALEIGPKLGFKDFRATSGWLHSFKVLHDISFSRKLPLCIS